MLLWVFFATAARETDLALVTAFDLDLDLDLDLALSFLAGATDFTDLDLATNFDSRFVALFLATFPAFWLPTKGRNSSGQSSSVNFFNFTIIFISYGTFFSLLIDIYGYWFI